MKIYLGKYYIIPKDDRYIITNLSMQTVNDCDGKGFRTKNRAYHYIEYTIEKIKNKK